MSETPALAPLPGEDGPLPMRYGGEPVTNLEALGVARRLARLFVTSQAEGSGRTIAAMAEVEEWPTETTMTQVAWRVPRGLILRVRARAEMEGLTVSQVVRDALEAYAAGSPGSKVTYPRPKVKGGARG
ncbi:MAG: hypothetical protein JJE50_04345 [Actinomycetales bacterium]|nr:hypothetical protein [Actinomycetales bacterium]